MELNILAGKRFCTNFNYHMGNTVWSLIYKFIFLLSKETVVLCEWESEMSADIPSIRSPSERINHLQSELIAAF